MKVHLWACAKCLSHSSNGQALNARHKLRQRHTRHFLGRVLRWKVAEPARVVRRPRIHTLGYCSPESWPRWTHSGPADAGEASLGVRASQPDSRRDSGGLTGRWAACLCRPLQARLCVCVCERDHLTLGARPGAPTCQQQGCSRAADLRGVAGLVMSAAALWSLLTHHPQLKGSSMSPLRTAAAGLRTSMSRDARSQKHRWGWEIQH